MNACWRLNSLCAVTSPSKGVRRRRPTRRRLGFGCRSERRPLLRFAVLSAASGRSRPAALALRGVRRLRSKHLASLSVLLRAMPTPNQSPDDSAANYAVECECHGECGEVNQSVALALRPDENPKCRNEKNGQQIRDETRRSQCAQFFEPCGGVGGFGCIHNCGV